MDTASHDLQFAFIYIDDIQILVASKDTKTRKEHLRLLLQRLLLYRLVVNVVKCQFGHSSLTLLGGHHITDNGIMTLLDIVSLLDRVPLADKVEAVVNMQ